MKIKDLLNEEFIIKDYLGHYSSFVGKICEVNLNPKNNHYEITLVYGDKTTCYRTSLEIEVNVYTKTLNPECFL